MLSFSDQSLSFCNGLTFVKNTEVVLEIVASFILILSIYFLGSLALVQEVIRPNKHLVQADKLEKGQWVTNYSKIILLSLLLSLITTTAAYFIFL
jgi:hypothetical protein